MALDFTSIINTAIPAASAIIVAYLTYCVRRENSDNRAAGNAENNSILRKLESVERRLRANDLKTSRIDLRTALCHSRDDIPAMLELALDYFVVQGGDADLGPKFLYWVKEYHVEQWAAEHGKDISQIIRSARHRKEG